MANTLLEPTIIAREALPILKNEMVMANLVYTDYSNEYQKKGDTVKARIPASFTAIAFDGDLTGQHQNITESFVDVALDTIADVTVDITSKELSLDIVSFRDQVIAPAMVAIAQKIDTDLIALYKNIPYFSGTSGTTPATTLAVTGARKVLNNNKTPRPLRRLVLGTDADAALVSLDAFAGLDKSGSPLALREAVIGRAFSFDTYMDQNIGQHTAGTFTAVASPTATGTAGNSIVNFAGGSGTETLLIGDILSISGYQYVITANATASGGAITGAAIYPALKTSPSSTAVVFPDKTALKHVYNLAFHRGAFTFVTRPQELPMGGASGAIETFENLPIRVTFGYNMETKSNCISFDILYGVKTTYKELACRLLG